MSKPVAFYVDGRSRRHEIEGKFYPRRQLQLLPPSREAAPPMGLDQSRRDSLVEIENEIRPVRSGPCLAIVGTLAITDAYYREHLRSGWALGPQTVHCGLPATVDIGFLACPKHGAEWHAEMLLHQVRREAPQ